MSNDFDEAGCQLYLISPPVIADVNAFSEQLKAALSVGCVGAFQLRLKSETLQEGRLTYDTASRDEVLKAAEVLLPICHEHEVAFILNDSPELSVEANADCVHIGQEDGSVEATRAIIGPNRAIGVSCHASKHLAMEAGEQGADYVAFGAFYPTQSKTPESLAKWGTPTTELLEMWSTYTTVPCVAIGGITPENAQPLVEAGADFIAVLSYIWNHPDGAGAAVKEFQKLL